MRDHAALDQLPLVQVQHAVGPRRRPGIVRHQQDRLSQFIPQFREQVEYLLGGVGVEVPGGLVGHDERRIGDDRPGDPHPLLLAAGELAGTMAEAVGQADQLQRRQHLAAPLRRRQRQQEQRQLDVLVGCQHRQEVIELEDKAEPPRPPVGQLRLQTSPTRNRRPPTLPLRWACPARQ